MGVRSVFIDVDLTLVDAHSNLRVGVIEALQEMVDYGYSLYAWSHGGYTRADQVIKRYKLEHYFRAWMGKPDMIIDDSRPEELVSERRINYLNSGKPGFWNRIWPEIFHKEVQFAEDKTTKGTKFDDPSPGPRDSEPGVGFEEWYQLPLWDYNNNTPETNPTQTGPCCGTATEVALSRCGCGRGFHGALGKKDGLVNRGDIVPFPDGGSTTSIAEEVGPGPTRNSRR